MLRSAYADLCLAYARHLPAVPGRMPSSFLPKTSSGRTSRSGPALAEAPVPDADRGVPAGHEQWDSVRGTEPGKEGRFRSYTADEKARFTEAVRKEIEELKPTKRAVFLDAFCPAWPPPAAGRVLTPKGLAKGPDYEFSVLSVQFSVRPPFLLRVSASPRELFSSAFGMHKKRGFWQRALLSFCYGNRKRALVGLAALDPPYRFFRNTNVFATWTTFPSRHAFGRKGVREAQPSAKELGEPEGQPFKTRLQQTLPADQAVAAQDDPPRHDDQAELPRG